MRMLRYSIALLLPFLWCSGTYAQTSLYKTLSTDICGCLVADANLEDSIPLVKCFTQALLLNEELFADSLLQHTTDTSYEAGVKMGQELGEKLTVSLAFDCAAYRIGMDKARYKSGPFANIDSVKTALLSANKKTSLSPEEQMDRGMGRMVVKDFAKALTDFDYLIANGTADKKNMATYFKAWTLEQMGDYDQAILLYQKAGAATGRKEFKIFEAIAAAKKKTK